MKVKAEGNKKVFRIIFCSVDILEQPKSGWVSPSRIG